MSVDRSELFRSALAKLTGDELEAVLIVFLGEEKYSKLVDRALAELRKSDPARYWELAEAAPGFLVEKLIEDILGR